MLSSKPRKKKTPEITKEIEQAIKETFKLDIPVLLCDQENIEKVCQKIPDSWVNNKDFKSDVLFLWEKFATKKTLQLIPTNPTVDSLLYVDGAIIPIAISHLFYTKIEATNETTCAG